MDIRAERAGDAGAIGSVHAAAFRDATPADREPIEVGLVEALRATDAWLPEFSLVAIVAGRVVGHCLSTRAHVEQHPVLGLGPIGVVPQSQGRGIGSALIEATIAAADTHGELLIGLVGDPQFYARFGFVAGTDLGVIAPDRSWGRYFQVRPLAEYRSEITGHFRYAAPFDEL